MKFTWLLSACVAAAGCHQPGPDLQGQEKAILAASKLLDRAIIEGDTAALDRLYTADYLVIGDDGQIHSKGDQLAVMAGAIDVLESTNDDVRVTMLGDGAALVTGRLSGRYRMQGQEARFVDRYTSIWVREAGSWRVRHEHSSKIPQTN